MNNNLWKPSAAIEHLRNRAVIIASLRDFFATRHYLEVETPILAKYGITDIYLSNIKAYFRGNPYHLQTSPEYHMKRLLAAGSGPIFQIARVFRDDELGRWHNPEFTLLEWYQLGIDHHDLMNEVNELLRLVLDCEPMRKISYQQAFIDACQIDPLHASIEQFKQCLQRFNLDNVLPADEVCRDQYLFLLMSHLVEPYLSSLPFPVAIYNFPSSQAALAQIHDGVAERFEVYYRGVELANGFHELTDPSVQRARFEEDVAIRERQGLPPCAVDEYFLQALEHGLPACSGVALGIDRLLTIAFDQPSIASCLAFDFSRA
ncbi:MAG: elongation factor P--(R)-beta-lysine ligase [Legionella sp.]